MSTDTNAGVATNTRPQPELPRTTFVTGDRLCASCGYNLIGQVIVREPHYELLVARCPECGAVASAQEYPLLGPWAHRWGMVLAALWVVLVVAGWVGSGAIIMGLGLPVAEEAARPYSSFIQTVFTEVEQQAKASAASGSSSAPGSTSNLPPETIIIQRAGGVQQITTVGGLNSSAGFEKWWKAQNHALLLDQAGGWRIGLTPPVFLMWFFCTLAVLAIGWFWAILLIHLRRRGLLIWAGSVFLLAVGFSLIPVVECLYTEPAWGWMAGRHQLTPIYLGCSVAGYSGALIIGVTTGRSLARQMIRMLLPPRMRHSLAALWTCDGRELPPIA